MKVTTFARFVGPSVLLMLALLALPLCVTFYLSVRNCALEMEVITQKQSGPFGTTDVITQRAKLDSNGQAIQTCKFVGFEYFRKVLGMDTEGMHENMSPPDHTSGAVGAGNSKPASTQGNTLSSTHRSTEFIGALRFTLLYTFVTTPFVLILGFLLALGVNRVTVHLKGLVISASLLPFIITPVVGALAIKWLFRDNGLVPYFLSQFGVSVFWMAEAWSARLLIIVYGIWHVVPFAFIVLYAGLQSVPQDSLEAATIDGASTWQKLRFVTLPHLAPLIVFIIMIHLMDAYRVFEPVVVLTQGAFTTSVQYLTYYILLTENNPYKASAAAVLTTLGIGVLLIPLLVKTWNEQRRGV
jgi:multiple sugar transport system permease protein